MNKLKKDAANLQKKDDVQSVKPLRELNLTDDFMFDMTTNNLECCQIILELSLGIRIKKIRWRENQKVIHNRPGDRGIRLDFYVEDENGVLYDVEMQKLNRGNLPKRTRFYQSLIDAPLLKSGEESFDHLNPSYIVVICDFDLYHQGKYRYTFTSQCREVQGLELGDGSTKVILNTRGKNDDEVEKSLVDFLHYVSDSKEKRLTEACDERVKRLHEIVESIRSNSEMEASYMKGITREREIIADAKEEGYKEGRIEGRIEGKKEGKKEGKAEGIEEGRRESKAESIIELLEELGDISDEISERICEEQDIQVLKRWLKIAARAESIKEFRDRM